MGDALVVADAIAALLAAGLILAKRRHRPCWNATISDHRKGLQMGMCCVCAGHCPSSLVNNWGTNVDVAMSARVYTLGSFQGK